MKRVREPLCYDELIVKWEGKLGNWVVDILIDSCKMLFAKLDGN
jgi:hypothetical protein